MTVTPFALTSSAWCAVWLSSTDPPPKNVPTRKPVFWIVFPFHPDLTDIFYSRWTQLDGFQRTRGILRTLASALREAERWDTCPLVGPAALLAAPDNPDISDAVKELANVADTADSGRSSDWGRLLQAELEKARQIQDELPTLRASREAEQAVMAVFSAFSAHRRQGQYAGTRANGRKRSAGCDRARQGASALARHILVSG